MVTDVINQNGSVNEIFFDFAKTFDKVPHRRLLAKLQAHRIDGRVVKWVASWLKGRKQRVCLEGFRSKWADVLSGIAQGSVLGPLLFLIFINDFEDDIMSMILKFADDTKMRKDGLRLSHSNLDPDSESADAGLVGISDWRICNADRRSPCRPTPC